MDHRERDAQYMRRAFEQALESWHEGGLPIGAVMVDGQDSLTRVEERLNVELPDVEGVISVGDLLTYLAGQIPIAGSVFVWEGLRFGVLEADARHVIRVRVGPTGGDESSDDD